MKYLFILVLITLITACTVPVRQSDIEFANYPVMPTEQESNAKIRSYFNIALKDPDSLRLECQPVRRGWARQFRDREAEFGWVIPCMVNAKNSFGGYTGAKPYVFLFSTGGFKVLDGSTFRELEEHVGYVN